ncbi:LytTR family two component transcriptional regulator [Lachnotalea glycerini]|jgi:DNA-binding LytR/AlgR family response regulator|uniref:Stage 0 sporulation protein A homolog n=1 Tax=Lachnotalea glycerini TaxID=1763509 RepID=A0A318EWK8_9FIRM|nr:LytTR family DNA-binding domain-containing protein [Lachnotalea glycerini]PXV95627.1 LytTR family two component transcriptional regulator [Lachnotalea glycerini]
MFHIAICDDEKRFIQYMKNIIYNAGLKRGEVIFYEFSSGEEFIDYLKETASFDLLILDMQLKNMDGNETAKEFRKVFPTTTLVFCSGVCMPTVRNFETIPFRYLLKGYTDERMRFEMKTIINEMINKKVEPFIIGNNHYNLVKLRPSDILYIAIAKRGSCIHICPNIIEYKFEENITSKEKIESLYNLLKDYGFAYAHNSYIVNLKYIKKVTTTELQLVDDTKLTISRSKAKNFREEFAKVLAKKY